MAFEEHLNMLMNGVDAWNKWRQENPAVLPNLSLLNYRNADLSGINLRGSELYGSDFSGSILRGANLWQASSCRSKFFEVDFQEADLSNTNFDQSLLMRSNFYKANLNEVSFCDSNLSNANLSNVDLSWAYLFRADLSNANLNSADLELSDLSGADLSGAQFVRANLREVNLHKANLSGTSFKNSTLNGTRLTDVDLTTLVNVTTTHTGPSTIDHRSIARALHCENLLPFLVDAGMPHIVATYLIDSIRSLDSNGLFNLMHSTFISYGGPDQQFAERLQSALDGNGVKTFLFTKQAGWGKSVHGAVRSGIHGHDRVILVCTEASLKRDGVLHEIELTLRRETSEGGAKLLIPVALDDYVWEGWEPENDHLKAEVLERVIGDAKGADTSQTTFDNMIGRLLEALKVSKES